MEDRNDNPKTQMKRCVDDFFSVFTNQETYPEPFKNGNRLPANPCNRGRVAP